MMTSFLRETIQATLFPLYVRRLTNVPKKGAKGHQQDRPVGVGLLYTHDPLRPEKQVAVLQLANQLMASGKQVKILCYLANKRVAPPLDVDVFTKDAISLLGKSSHEPLNNFLKSPFAYLYHLDLASDAVLDYVVAKCAASCKIGNYQAARERLFEIMFKDLVPSEDSFERLINKMLNYTQQLKV